MQDISREMWIDTQMEHYSGFLAEDWAKAIAAKTETTPVLGAILFDLLMDWRTTSYTASTPRIIVDSVQAAAYLVAAPVEFPARVQRGHDHLDRGLFKSLMPVDRDPPPVVLNRHAPVHMDRDTNPIAVTSQGFINRVIHDLMNEVM